MSSDDRCPRCGGPLSPVAEGTTCPACLMKLALGQGLDTREFEKGQLEHGQVGPDLPEIAELEPWFPELELLGQIGRGGMGVVYQARQRSLDRLVALKIIHPPLVERPGFAERFTREAKTLARLNHPHIVTVHDFGRRGGYYFLLMEFLDGGTLRRRMAAGQLSPSDALALVAPLCDALQYAHEQGVVHRDIKPENILFDRQGRVKVADFGLAKLLRPDRDDSTLTASCQVFGTPRYMAPEQMRGSTHVDHRADIYSLGVVLYELLTGELPMGRFEPPSSRAKMDGGLDAVVLRALEQDPARRYQHAADVRTDLDSVVSGKALNGQASAPARKPPAKDSSAALSDGGSGRGRKKRWLLVAAGGLLLLALLAVGLYFGRGVAGERLREAAWQGELAKTKFWRWAGAPVDARDEEGVTALMLAAAAGHEDVAAALLDAGASPDRADALDQTPLHRAAEGGHAAVVQLLLERGAELESTDQKGMTPLLWAAWSGDAKTFEVLRRAGADLTVRSRDRETALMKAAFQGDPRIVESLLAAGVDVNAGDQDGETALMVAVATHADRRIVEALLAAGADVDARDKDGETALLFAAADGQHDMVSLLLRRNPDVDAPTNAGLTPLLMAARRGHARVVEALLDAGAEVDQQDATGLSALDHAVAEGHGAVADRLLAAGAETRGPYLLWQGWRLARQGQWARALPLLHQAGDAAVQTRTPWRMAIDGWSYQVPEPRVLAWLLAGEVIRRMDNDSRPSATQTDTADAETGNAAGVTGSFERALAAFPEGEPDVTLFRRELVEDSVERIQVYELARATVERHVANPDEAWHLSMAFREVERRGNSTRTQSGTQAGQAFDFFK